MSNLKIVDLYNQTDSKVVDGFSKKINSTLDVSYDYDKVDCDYEWLDIMEDTIKYLDNILRNPNRFIVNEEEVIKIELARRVTVESIKHLSRNTNLIQDYDKKTGDVKPSKILNINKEESYNTYENRFIYSLIQNMKSFIARKKSMGISDSSLKDNKCFLYNGSAKMGECDVNVSMRLDSKIDSLGKKNGSDGLSIADRIDRLEMQIADLTNSEVYKSLAKLHIALVTSPIKKTNVILKNVNFQYAVKLWNYMQVNLDGNSKRVKDSKKYQDKGDLKQCVDETFLLNYLVMSSINGEVVDDKVKGDIRDRLVNNMVEQIVSLDSGLSCEELKDLVGRQFEVVKYRNVTSDKAIYRLFNKYLDKYLDLFNNLKI